MIETTLTITVVGAVLTALLSLLAAGLHLDLRRRGLPLRGRRAIQIVASMVIGSSVAYLLLGPVAGLTFAPLHGAELSRALLTGVFATVTIAAQTVVLVCCRAAHASHAPR